MADMKRKEILENLNPRDILRKILNNIFNDFDLTAGRTIYTICNLRTVALIFFVICTPFETALEDAFPTLRKVLRHMEFSRETMKRILNHILILVLFYRSEYWTFSSWEKGIAEVKDMQLC